MKRTPGIREEDEDAIEGGERVRERTYRCKSS